MNILIIEVNWLGDVLFSTPAIKALRKKYPDSYIACLIVPRVREVLENNPNVNELIINDEEGIHKGFLGKARLVSELKKKKFDMAILFHRSFTRAALTYWAGIPQRAGYSTWKRRFLLTHAIPMPEKDSLHRVEYYLNIVEPLGCDTAEKYYELFTTEDDNRFIETLFFEQGIAMRDFVVCLNPGGNWNPKRWPKEHFAQLADILMSEYQAKIIFSGSQNDVLLIKEITGLMQLQPIVAAGKISLNQSAGLFKKVDLVISADSGPLHIAASVGANVLALFGPTSPVITGPIGKGKIIVLQKDVECGVPCYDTRCVDNRCMQDITVEEVISAVKEFLPVKRP